MLTHQPLVHRLNAARNQAVSEIRLCRLIAIGTGIVLLAIFTGEHLT